MLHRLKTAKASRVRRAVLLIGAAAATLGIAGLAPASLGSAAYAQLMSPGEIIKRSRARIPAPMPSPGREPAEAAPAASAPTTTGQGINGAMHQAHVGQVVFTRSDLERNGITEAALVNSFRLGDPIFFRVYMREPVIEQFKPKLPGKSNYWISRSIRYKARFTVGGNVVDTKFRIWGKAGDHETWTTWRGELLSRADKFQPGTEIFREFLSRATKRGLMGVGTHQIKLEITPYAINIDVKLDGSSSEPPVAVGEVVASGEFSLTVGPGSYAKSDPKICGPATASANPALEQQILTRARYVDPARGSARPGDTDLWRLDYQPPSDLGAGARSEYRHGHHVTRPRLLRLSELQIYPAQCRRFLCRKLQFRIRTAQLDDAVLVPRLNRRRGACDA